jgi:hypothetical protein
MNKNLNEDLFNYIYQLIPLIDRQNFKRVSKFFNNLYQNDLNNIIQIQKFYKKYKIDDDYLYDASLDKYKEGYLPASKYNYYDWNRFLLYRYYISRYEDRCLFEYPEFLTNKAIKDNVKKNNALNWINHNLNQSIELRKKSNIYKFFVENNISSKEILVAGW